jgi:hypothetical protein
MQAHQHWIIKVREITPKNFRYELECKCSKCGKKLSLKDVFYCFEPNRKIESDLHRELLCSAFFCANCAKKE